MVTTILFTCKLTNEIIFCEDFDSALPTPKNPKGRKIIIIDSDYYHSKEKQEHLDKFIAESDQRNWERKLWIKQIIIFIICFSISMYIYWPGEAPE